MRQYEMTYLVSDKVSDADMNATTGKINAIITDRKGKILGEESWGRRKLAYPILKQDFATYITLNFELNPEELGRINRELKLNKEVIRHLILVKDFGKEKITLSAEEVAENAEIEAVVGGERSFEAVEGETEESYDLMAKREDEEEAEEAPAETEESKEEAPVKEEETAEETPVVEEVKKTEKKAAKTKKSEEVKEEAKSETPKKKVSKKKAESKQVDADKEKKAEAEADRLAKLDEEIEGILGDDL